MRSVRGSMRIRVDRGVSASVRRGRVGGGKHVAVNFPLTLFTAEDEQLVVCLPRYLMSGEDFLLSGRSSTPVRQVAHLQISWIVKTTLTLTVWEPFWYLACTASRPMKASVFWGIKIGSLPYSAMTARIRNYLARSRRRRSGTGKL